LHVALVGFLLQITSIFSYITCCELTLPCNISQCRKWCVATPLRHLFQRAWSKSRWSVAHPADFRRDLTGFLEPPTDFWGRLHNRSFFG